MVEPDTRYPPHILEEEARALWRNRRLPPAGGLLGRADGPVVRQFVGAFTDTDALVRVAQRAVAADVDARYLLLSGRRASATHRRVAPDGDPAAAPIGPVLTSLGVWVGGEGARPWDDADRSAGRAAIVGRLARDGVLVSKDAPFRVCPNCASVRGPERIVYAEEEGDTYLVRFPTRIGERVVALLVWVDAPWRLLGTSALVVNPEFPYVVARFRRRDADELVVTSRSSLDRLRTWLAGAEIEIVDELAGKSLVGTVYEYPLRHEFPMGGTLAPPAGTVQATADVGDSGTGIVPLVPGHGGTDAQIAERLGVSGWPLLTPRGHLDLTLMHKYAGLDLTTANDFVLRDLAEEGAIFARLRVRRGVPHCMVCGSRLVWAPGRAWCLEPTRLAKDAADAYRRLLPNDPALVQIEVATWPVSETSTSDAASAVVLLECSRCDRLEGPPADLTCSCGGRRRLVGRRLLPSFDGAVSAWSRTDPLPFGDTVRAYLNDRRRTPALVHQLAAASVVEGASGEFSIAVLPTVPEVDLAALLTAHGADAVRAAFVRSGGAGGGARGFADHCVQEKARLGQFWSFVHRTFAGADRATRAALARPERDWLGELEPEDRAFLARWERVRTLVVADYERWAPADALNRLHRFLELDLTEYRTWVADRLALPPNASGRRGALRTLFYVLRSASVVLAPVAPFVAESVHRMLSPDPVSLFEGAIPPPERTLANDPSAAAWDRWRSVVTAVGRFRTASGLSASTTIPSVALVVASDDLAEQLRADGPTVARLARVGRVEVGSPRTPWAGRQRVLRPNEGEIQRAYPTLAAQVVHLLQRTPARPPSEGGPEELNVVIQGLSRKITPSMYEYVTTLPPNVVGVPWNLGELYAERPGPATATARTLLSPDAYWLVRRVQKRLRGRPPSTGRSVAVVAATNPLADELRANAPTLASQLGLDELRVTERADEAPTPGRVVGRTRTGARWWVDLPGLVLPRRAPGRRAAPRRTVRAGAVPPVPALGPDEVDFADARVIAREQSVRELVEQLDGLLGAPLLGPSKVAGAWDGGITTLEAYRTSDFDRLAVLPGFGPTLTAELFAHLGRTPPPRPPASHAPSRVHPAEAGRPRSTPVAASPSPETPALPSAAAVPAGSTEEVGPAAVPPAPPTQPPPVPPSEPLPALPPALAPAMETGAPPEAPPPTEPPGGNPETGEGNAPAAEGTPLAAPPASESAPTEPEAGTADESGERVSPEAEEAPVADAPSTSGPEAENLVAPAGPHVDAPPPDAPSDTVSPEETSEPPVPDTAEEPRKETAGPVAAEGPLMEPPVPVAAEGPLMEPPVPVAAEEPPMEPPAPVTAEEPPEEPTGPGPSVEPPAHGPSPEAPVPMEPSSPETPVTPAPRAELAMESPALAVHEAAPPIVASEPPASDVSPPPFSDPPVAAPAPAEPVAPAPPTGIELLSGGSLLASLQPFLDAAAAGLRGLAVVRESPERIRAHAGNRPVEVYWLTNFGRGPSLRPGDLDAIQAFLEKALLDLGVTVFFVEGVEYLVRLHGIARVVALLVEFDRRLREREARAWVHLTPDLLSEADVGEIRAVLG